MINTREILRTAWTIAREGAAKFGGRPVQYIAQSLRQAWAAIKVAALVNTTARLYSTAKVWAKAGHVRVYVSDIKGNGEGYIAITASEGIDMSNCRGDLLRAELRAAGYAW